MKSKCTTDTVKLREQGIDEDSMQLILIGVIRELKLRQMKMLKHSLSVAGDAVFVHSEIDVFARGKRFVIGSLLGFLLLILIAVFTSVDGWEQQLGLLKALGVLLVLFVPLAYGYLLIEKRMQHYRLRVKMEAKLKQLTDSKAKVQEMLAKPEEA